MRSNRFIGSIQLIRQASCSSDGSTAIVQGDSKVIAPMFRDKSTHSTQFLLPLLPL
jgi:hypothetical protein